MDNEWKTFILQQSNVQKDGMDDQRRLSLHPIHNGKNVWSKMFNDKIVLKKK